MALIEVYARQCTTRDFDLALVVDTSVRVRHIDTFGICARDCIAG